MKLKIILCLALVLSGGLFATPSISLAASPESNQSLLDWNMKTYVDAYKKVGKTDAKWDRASHTRPDRVC